MPDNVVIEDRATSTMVSVSTDAVASRHYETWKLNSGADGEAVPVDSDHPLPVSMGQSPQGHVTYHRVSTGNGADAVNLWRGAACLYGLDVFNNAEYPIYVKFHDVATVPYPGVGVVRTFGIQAGVRGRATFRHGMKFTNGIGMTIVRNIDDNDTTSVDSEVAIVNLDLTAFTVFGDVHGALTQTLAEVTGRGNNFTASDYFSRLVARDDCVAAVEFSSQAEMNLLTPIQKPYDPVTQKKRPIVYDTIENAAMVTIHPPESTDSQQLWPRVVACPPGQRTLILWDIKFNENFQYRQGLPGLGDVNRHKVQQLGSTGGGAWLTQRSFYDEATIENIANGETWRVANMRWTANNQWFVLPPTFTVNEVISPYEMTFFAKVNTWMRMAILMEDVCSATEYPGPWPTYPAGTDPQYVKWPNSRVTKLSVWMGDEERDMAPYLDEAMTLQIYTDGIILVRLEWDMGEDSCPEDDRMLYAWHRNLIQLMNPPSDVTTLFERPAP